MKRKIAFGVLISSVIGLIVSVSWVLLSVTNDEENIEEENQTTVEYREPQERSEDIAIPYQSIGINNQWIEFEDSGPVQSGGEILQDVDSINEIIKDGNVAMGPEFRTDNTMWFTSFSNPGPFDFIDETLEIGDTVYVTEYYYAFEPEARLYEYEIVDYVEAVQGESVGFDGVEGSIWDTHSVGSGEPSIVLNSLSNDFEELKLWYGVLVEEHLPGEETTEDVNEEENVDNEE